MAITRRNAFLAITLLLAASAAPAQTTVTVTGEPLSRAPFLGFGVQWSAYPWCDPTDSDWQRVYERLDYMRVPLVRCMLRAYWYCDGYDAQGKPVYNWRSARMQKLYRLLDYCQDRSVPVMIGEWDDPACDEDRQDPKADRLQPYEIEETDPRWSVLICDLLDHLISERGYTCLRYYNLINEPNGDWSGCADFDRWKLGIQNLHRELGRRGLLDQIGVIGPDTTWQKDHYWVELAVRQLPEQMAAYEVHEYAPIADVESGWLEQHFRVKKRYIERYDWAGGAAKPFFMGEVGMDERGPVEPRGGEDSHPKIYDHIYGVWIADYLVQCSRAGMDGAVAWMLDDAMHIVKDPESTWPDLDGVLWKKWGFFNSMAEEIGHPEDAALRPWFYTWSLMARAVPAGSRIVACHHANVAGLRVMAARTPTGHTTFVVVNDADESRGVDLVDGGADPAQPWSRYHYFPNDRPTDAKGYPIAKATDEQYDFAAGERFDLPPRSVLLLTSQQLSGHRGTKALSGVAP
ncbi:MAG: cellulase family glycosylhydrolase [Planctomycetota bacterium]